MSVGDSTESNFCRFTILSYRKFKSASFIYHTSDVIGTFGYIAQQFQQFGTAFMTG